MKKCLIAMASLAVAGMASAQSSVTLTGVVDAALQHGTGSGPGSASKTQLGSGGYNSSRLVFRGTEDLGAGLAASFWLEAGLLNDNGTGFATNTNNQASGTAVSPNGTQGLTFNRRSTVSLSGHWGEVRLGRDFIPHFWSLAVFDPYGTSGVGTNQVFISQTARLYPAGIANTGPVIRASNSIGYFLPGNLGGVYGQAMVYMGENAHNGAATQDDGSGASLRVGYAKGPLDVAFAYGRTDYASGDVRSMNIGGSWNFGVAKLMGMYSRDRVSSAVPLEGHGGLIGGLVPVGAGEIRLSYSFYKLDSATNPASKKLALGYVHNLSKRTALYATYARLTNSGSANLALNGAITAAGRASGGWDVGIRHSF